MSQEAAKNEILNTLSQINKAWLGNQSHRLKSWFHPDMVMAFPGFSGQLAGGPANIAGFEDFCTHARVHHYQEADHQIMVIGETGVASLTYEMIYERGSKKNHATGRDLWVFQKTGDGWLAVWRTMLDTKEEPARD